MDIVSVLPSEPLDSTERDRIRTHDEVEALTSIGTTAIDERRKEQTESAASMVILTNGTVYALDYEEFEWSAEVLQRNADRQDHLERALDQMDHRHSP